MTTCGNCGRPAATPDSIDIDPICDLCIWRMAPATTILDCHHTLDNAMQDAVGVWYCLHRGHREPMPIIMDPIAHKG